MKTEQAKIKTPARIIRKFSTDHKTRYFNSDRLERIKLSIEIGGILLLLATVACNVWLNLLTAKANKINGQTLEANQRALDINQKSLTLTQQSIDLTQKSLALNQQSVKAAQDALNLTGKANEISKQGMVAANTPWLSIEIQDVEIVKLGIEISYTISNESEIPAHRIWTVCTASTSPECADIGDATMMDAGLVLMPKQKLPRKSDLITAGNPRVLLDQIKSKRIPVNIFLIYYDSLGNKTKYLETFRWNNDRFWIEGEDFNPSASRIDKALK